MSIDKRLTAQRAWDRIEQVIPYPLTPRTSTIIRKALRELARASYQRGYEMSERTQVQSLPEKLEQAYELGRVDSALEQLK